MTVYIQEMKSKELDDITKISNEYFHRCEKIVALLCNGGDSSYSHRKAFSISSYEVCIEHCRSDIYLLMHAKIATSLSLLRVAFEAYIRSRWLHHCASDSELAEFKNTKEILFPKKKNIISDINLDSCLYGNYFISLINGQKELLDDFTHTGSTQIIRRILDNRRQITEEFKKTEALGIMELLAIIQTNAYIGICELSNNKTSKDEISIHSKNLIDYIQSEIRDSGTPVRS